MAFRILYIIIALIAGFLSYDIYRLYTGIGSSGNVPAEYTLGSQDADITVVEFLDYGCKYCSEVHPIITSAVKQDGNVRYIPRPLPMEDQEATRAAILAYAAGKQGKFIEMHDLLIKNYRVIDDAVISELGQKIGLDIDQLNIDIEDTGVIKDINKNARIFKKIGENRTPAFVLNNKIVFVPEERMPTVNDFLQMFNNLRKNH
ncbi:MAG: thioredoxin domain-containing protein [Alphaproteobacteria bacterium]|nr:thioredoxin domain-containing protein [Alphaproteobacteria bacterium]